MMMKKHIEISWEWYWLSSEIWWRQKGSPCQCFRVQHYRYSPTSILFPFHSLTRCPKNWHQHSWQTTSNTISRNISKVPTAMMKKIASISFLCYSILNVSDAWNYCLLKFMFDKAKKMRRGILNWVKMNAEKKVLALSHQVKVWNVDSSIEKCVYRIIRISDRMNVIVVVCWSILAKNSTKSE